MHSQKNFPKVYAWLPPNKTKKDLRCTSIPPAPNPPTGWCSTRENGSCQQLSHPLLICLSLSKQIEVEYLLETPISQVSRSFPTPTKPNILFLETTPRFPKNTKRQDTCHALWPKAMGHRAQPLDHPNSPCSRWWCLEDHPRTPKWFITYGDRS